MSEILDFVDTHYAEPGWVYTSVNGIHIFRADAVSKDSVDIYEPCLYVSLRGLKACK
ncbi:hypothetical protein [Campylobacter sp. 19-13652]|uniref:hypothetical protein n=1 Tax=Campylobacter sp. 19-13652 TaxID=2840180 RepID=UPI001C78CE5E|nr:hypothetical protein [Campylobacter sp. 19-13652]BCX79396.1 hypothetical protein LBC_08580 [Campylobacter sp. 19-13652]